MSRPITRLTERGPNKVLPIIGWTVSRVSLRSFTLPYIEFSMAEHQDARLELEASIVTLRWAGQEQTLRWDENRPYPPAVLAPFVEILGRTVKDAVALKAGALHLEFSGNVTLAAVPDVWEGWHFYSSEVSLIGDDGRLISFV